MNLGRLLLITLVACGASTATDDSSTGGEDVASGSVDLAGFPVDEDADLVTGGQPDPAQLEALIERHSLRAVVNLRVPGEPGTEGERERVESAGATYVSIPIAGAEDLTEANARLLADAIAPEGTELVHCASGNRVGALFGMKTFVVDGGTRTEAIQAAEDHGISRLRDALAEALDEQCATISDDERASRCE